MKRSAMPARTKPIRQKRKGKRRRDFDQPTPAAVEARNAKLRDLGCIACLINGYPGTPPELHHPRSGTAGGQRASDLETIGLCPAHHRGTDHPHTSSIHLDKPGFVAQYGTEAELLERVNGLIW